MTASRSRKPAPWLLVLVVVLYATLAAGYFVLRYGGRWADSDTGYLTAASAAVYEQGTLLATGEVYELGFAYQAVTTFVMALTGLSPSQLQFLVYPLVAAGLSLVAFASYRVLTGDATAGALATLLLFMQPDFLFVIFRGSHEKLTWLCALLALFVLAKSFAAARQLSRFAAYVGLFYLATWGAVAGNAFLGSSFIVAVAASLVASLALLRVWQRREAVGITRPPVARLAYVVAASMVLWYLNAFYLYPRAGRSLFSLQYATDRAAAVALGREVRYDPYAAVRSAWVSQSAYLGLTLPSWVAASASAVAWLSVAVRLLRSGNPFRDRRQFLLWVLYGGFGLQLALGALLAYSGGISGNLQVRLFPAFMLLAFPLLTSGIAPPFRAPRVPPRSRRWVVILLLVTLWASVASLLKATNEASLANYWNFWTPAEERAVHWVESALNYRSVWLGYGNIRASARATGESFGRTSDNTTDSFSVDTETRDLILSSAEAQLSLRRGAPLPDVRAENRVYDNGWAQMYHKRPRTPYQR